MSSRLGGHKPASQSQTNGFDNVVNGNAMILGSSSSPALGSVEREVSDVSDITGDSGRLRSPTKQVTLPSVKRIEPSREAWPEANGHIDMAEPTPTDDAARVSLTNGAAGDQSDSDSSSDEGDEVRKAPDQLRMEFLDCLMKKDYPNALKLCKMILIYEPKHELANKFLPLIGEKIELDNRPSESDDSDDSDDEDDEDDDDDEEGDSDDSDDDSDSDDSESESDDDDDDDQETLVRAVLESRLDDS